MGNREDRPVALFCDPGQQGHDGSAVFSIERGSRFVGKDDGRVTRQRACDRQALLLTTARRARIGAVFVAQAHFVEGARGEPACFRALETANFDASRIFSVAVNVGKRL